MTMMTMVHWVMMTIMPIVMVMITMTINTENLTTHPVLCCRHLLGNQLIDLFGHHHNSLDNCMSHLGCDPFPRALHHTDLPYETEGRPHQCSRQMGQGDFHNAYDDHIMEPNVSPVGTVCVQCVIGWYGGDR